jgi:hypothetical protein
VPAVSVKVTVPVGALESVVVSVTVAVIEVVQLLPPTAIVQLTFGTVVEVLSLEVTVTLRVVVAAEVVAPDGLPVTMKLYDPAATVVATSIVNTLAAPIDVGVTGLTVKVPHVMPDGREADTHDKVTC